MAHEVATQKTQWHRAHRLPQCEVGRLFRHLLKNYSTVPSWLPWLTCSTANTYGCYSLPIWLWIKQRWPAHYQIHAASLRVSQIHYPLWMSIDCLLTMNPMPPDRLTRAIWMRIDEWCMACLSFRAKFTFDLTKLTLIQNRQAVIGCICLHAHKCKPLHNMLGNWWPTDWQAYHGMMEWDGATVSCADIQDKDLFKIFKTNCDLVCIKTKMLIRNYFNNIKHFRLKTAHHI